VLFFLLHPFAELLGVEVPLLNTLGDRKPRFPASYII
jgi:hypothetical protein